MSSRLNSYQNWEQPCSSVLKLVVPGGDARTDNSSTVREEPHRQIHRFTTSRHDNGVNTDSNRWWNKGGPDGCFPRSDEEARNHIEWIRDQKKVDKPDQNARTLHAVLKQ